MSDILVCRTCGDQYALPEGEELRACPSCGTVNSCSRAEEDVREMLVRATRQRLKNDFAHAENSYQYVLREYPDEHEALWGLAQCRYGVEYVEDAHTGRRMPVVHAVRKRPMLTDPDFRQACELAPEEIRAQYVQEAEYVDKAMAQIREMAESGEGCDVFLCHKTTRTDGVPGYTEDYNRAVQLYVKLEKAGYRVFFAPFAGLTPGESYEAGIYHALSSAKVMLVVCSRTEHITSPWVRTEWQRFLEMSYEEGSRKRLIPLLYEGFPPRRLPEDFRQLQAITMGELDATETLMAALEKHVGKASPEKPAPAAPVKAEPVMSVPSAPAMADAAQADMAQLLDSVLGSGTAASMGMASSGKTEFLTEIRNGCSHITGYIGEGGEVSIPQEIDGVPVTEVARNAFAACERLTAVILPEGLKKLCSDAFRSCRKLERVELPSTLEEVGDSAFNGCLALTAVSIPEGVRRIGNYCFSSCTSLRQVSLPEGLTEMGFNAFELCSALQMIALPESLVVLEEQTFRKCTALERVKLSASMRDIGSNAFVGCRRLYAVNLPDGDVKLGTDVFRGCDALPRGIRSRSRETLFGLRAFTGL